MLPTVGDGSVSLADVMRDCLSAVRGESGRLGLPRVDRALVVLIDGLGAENLKARAGHARTLASAMRTKADILDTGVPTTTAAALASLTTGSRPGQHGVVAYSGFEPASGAVVNQLHGFDDGALPSDWLRRPTLFSQAVEDGFSAFAFGAARYRDSGFTREVLAGAQYVPGVTIEDRVDAAADVLADRSWRGIGYCYLAELDMAGHDAGWQSGDWVAALERVDAALGGLVASLDPSTGVIVTADHGMIDVPEHSRLAIPDDSGLWGGVAALAGEHRLLHLHVEPDMDPNVVAARWVDAEGGRSWVATRDEAIEAGWFGMVDPGVRERIGDVIVAARKDVAYYTETALAGSAGRMVGQHGSWTPAERRVPLLRFGAFSRP